MSSSPRSERAGKTDVDSNLFQVLKLRAEDVPGLLDWIKDGKYLSHDIINELINLMGNEVLRSIVADIHQQSKLFSIISYESRDISNKEQLTCVPRWVSMTDLSDFQVMSRFSWHVPVREN